MDVSMTQEAPALSPDQEDAMMREVNAHYNSAIKFQKGKAGWQMQNLPDGGEGDCDTYARTKGEALVAKGFPQSKLAIVVGQTWDGQDHAVLRVERDKGKYVYLTNPLNKSQRQNPDLAVLNELPGKERMMPLSYTMWAPWEKIQARRNAEKK